MKDVKPILVIRVPSEIHDQMENEISELDINKDYYVFLFSSTDFYEPTIEVIYKEDFNRIKYEKLKETIYSNSTN